MDKLSRLSVRTGQLDRMVSFAGVLLLAFLFAPARTSAVLNEKQEPTIKAPWNPTWVDTLKRSLLAGYDKFARPSHHLTSTNVTLGLTINHVELEDDTGIMTVHGWVKMLWNDDKLKWNSSEYGNLKNLHLADHEIWQPDIVQYNSASGSQVDQYGNTHCIVSEAGNVIWVPPTKLTAFCNIDLTLWPADTQTCIFTFGSWTYDSLRINIEHTDIEVPESDDVHKVIYGEWEVVKVETERHEKVYPCCTESYVSVNYEVTVRRRGAGGVRGALIKTPAGVAGLLSLLSHCLPPHAPLAPRLPLAVAPPTILSLGLLYFSHRLPSVNNTPDIVMLYGIILYMTCLSAVVSIIVLNMALSRKALPWTIRRILCSKAAKCLRLPKLAENSTGEELQGTTGGAGSVTSAEEGARMLSGTPAPARDWLALATALDRIFFIILLVVYIIVIIIYGC